MGRERNGRGNCPAFGDSVPRSFFGKAGEVRLPSPRWRVFSSGEGLIGLAILGGLILAPSAPSATATVTQTLNLQLTATGKLSVPATATLTTTGTLFNAYSGSLTVNYRVRTTTSGAGSITVQATANFSPSGGPNVSSNTLTYACSGATLGTPCSGTQTVSLVSATNVLTVPASACTGGGGACSSADPNSTSVNFSLTNQPSYETGSFSASVTFTISST